MAAPQRSNFNTSDNLTSMVVQFMAQRDHFATRVAPVKMTTLESGKFSVKDFDLMRQQVLEKIGDDGEARELQSRYVQRPYACVEFGGRRTVTRTKARRSALVGVDAAEDAMEDLLETTMHTLDQAVSDTAFKTGQWATDVAGVAAASATNAVTNFIQWSDRTNATIIRDIERWSDQVKATCGEKPNQLVLGLDVWRIVKNNPDILDRIKHTQRGVVTEELFASLIGIPEVVIAETTYNSAKRGQDAAIARWLAGQALLHVRNEENSDNIRSGVCIAEWGDPSIPRGVDGLQTRQWPSYEKDGTVYEARVHYDVVLASRERGLFASSVI